MASAPLYLRIAEGLARKIAFGVYPVGSQLPTEAELCATHEVSRSTAREAMRCLVDRGMISRRVRHGSRVISAAPIGDTSRSRQAPRISWPSLREHALSAATTAC